MNTAHEQKRRHDMGLDGTGQEHWNDFLNNSTIGVHLVRADGRIQWANTPELDFLGYSAEEYVGKHISEFHVDPEVITKILAILGGGGMLNAYPARLRARNGTIKHVLINSNVYRVEGDFVHTRCFTTAISEQVHNVLRIELKDG